MVRRHGWQLPAHAFQVVAITAFFLLAVAFYVFLAPFLGNKFVEYSAIFLYSVVAVTVFLLYVRCSAIDPADPGVFAKSLLPSSKSELQSDATRRPPQPSISMSSSSRTKPFSKAGQHVAQGWDVLPPVEAAPLGGHFLLTALSCVVCTWFVRPDNCRGRSTSQQPIADEEILFCTLCNAEVRKHSKHCRSCDKCVDGFDHHCRWLNNCVGRKNYGTFVALMFTSLVLLALEWGIGTAVLVRCFVDRRGVERQIVDKLGNSFSKPPFATLVAICAGVSFVATIPLGELLFFHLILIRKGISTYEYVIAMRAQGEMQAESADGDVPSVPSTPASSTATGLSGSSSMGLHNRGAWCTPPKIFVEHQDEVIPHLDPGRVRSTVDPDALGNMVGRELRMAKRPVRISAWKLAKLNAEEAARAAVKARENSSVLRYLGGREAGKPDIDYSSSDNLSRGSSVSNDHRFAALKTNASGETSCHTSQAVWRSSHMGGGEWNSALERPRSVVDSPSSRGNGLMQTPAGRFIPANGLVFTAAGSSCQQEAKALPFKVASSAQQKQSTGRVDTAGSVMVVGGSSSWVDLSAASDGYEASSGDSADDSATSQNQHDMIFRKTKTTGSQKAQGVAGDENPSRRSFQIGRMDDPNVTLSASMFSRSRLAWPDPSASPVSDEPLSDFASEALSSSQASPSGPRMQLVSPPGFEAPSKSDILRFNGTCIFYGGPLTLTAQLPTERDYGQSLPPKLPTMHQEYKMHPLRELKLGGGSRPVMLRSQSPVFEPHPGNVT